MKNLITLFSFLLITVFSLAQSEGHVSYEITATSDDPEKLMAIEMMKEMTMDVYFKDNMTRSDVKMGIFLDLITLYNSSDDKVLMLLGGMMGNKVIATTQTEMNEDSDKKEEEDVKIKKGKGKKVIAGYKCKKVILTDSEGTETIYWYTKKIKNKAVGNQFINSKVPGFTMEMISESDGMVMLITVKSFVKEVSNPEEIFDMTIPADYEEMTYKEFSSMGQ